MYRILVGISEGKRPLGRPMRRWEDNIKTNIQGVGGGVWSGSIRLRILVHITDTWPFKTRT